MFTINLNPQVILVTGGSRGIGSAIARQLGKAGAQLAIHYHHHREGAEIASEGFSHARLFQADLGDPQACQTLIQEVIEAFGRIDVLVNNAGIAQSVPMEASSDTWVESWRHTLDVNLLASAALSKAAIPYMIDQGGGRLIHIASRAAFRGDTPDYLAYAASKGGMVAMSRSLARFYGKQGIKSFVVAPGFTRTDMAKQFMDEYGEDWALHDIALPTLTEPEDIAPTIAFLASGYMDHATGCTIDLNAGSYVH